MRFRRLTIALFAVSLIPVLWLEADALTTTCVLWKTVGGSKVCAQWKTGSEIGIVKISGLVGGLGEGGEAADVQVSFEAMGAGEGGRMTGSLFCAIPGGGGGGSAAPADADCNHTFNGVGTGHTTNAGNPGHAGDCNVFRNVTTTGPVDIMATVGINQCDPKTGVCQTSAELTDPGDGQTLCDAHGGGTFVSFTADAFIGKVQVTGLPGDVMCTIEQACTLVGNGYNCVPTSEPSCDDWSEL